MVIGVRMSATSAYWITPKGVIVEPATYHIGSVIKYPKKFGLSADYLKSVYDKHNERMSPHLEGKAREEIMAKLIRSGYVRIRQMNRGNFTIQLNKLTPKVTDDLWLWANKMINDKIIKDKYADVVIHQLSNRKMTRTSLNDLASGATIKESIGGERRLLLKEDTDKVKIYTEDEYMNEDDVIYKHLK